MVVLFAEINWISNNINIERKVSKPIPIMRNNNNFVDNINNNKLIKQSPMFIENSSSNDYIILSNDNIKVIKREDRDNYMEQEDYSSSDDELYQRPHSVKNYINNSLNYLKNSMDYFYVYKNSSL